MAVCIAGLLLETRALEQVFGVLGKMRAADMGTTLALLCRAIDNWGRGVLCIFGARVLLLVCEAGAYES